MVGCSSEHHLQGQLNDTWVLNGVMAHTEIRVDRLLSSENCVWLKTLTAAARPALQAFEITREIADDANSNATVAHGTFC